MSSSLIVRGGAQRGILSSTIVSRLETMSSRHAQILEQMRESGFSSPEIGKELSSLAQVASLRGRLKALEEEELSFREMYREATTTGDKELEMECQTEISRIEKDRLILEPIIIDSLLPNDEEDLESNAIFEIRAGIGGDEACLFANELVLSYIKSARAIQWKAELMYESKTDLGGTKEASIFVSGRPITLYDNDTSTIGPYGLFQYESGVHRVQRVPINSSKLQTSACSVAVLPSPSDHNSGMKEFLPLNELRIDTMRSSGAGGQSVNTTDSAVRITHIPTGITASIQDERSQHMNKEKAMKLVTARVRDQQKAMELQKRGETRSNLMGGGDRSERIRTYNYPQDRVTDHRCKESKHGIAILMEGSREDGLAFSFFPFLKAMRREEKLQQLEHKEQSTSVTKPATTSRKESTK